MNRKKRKKLFQPSLIVTTIEKALKRDLDYHLQEYPIVLSTNPEASKLLCDRQVSEFRKKFTDPDSNHKESLERLTFKKFKKVNRHMRKYGDQRFPYDKLVHSRRSFEDKVLLKARCLMRNVLNDFSIEEWFTSCKNSGGSSLGVPFSDTSVERKFQYPITCTESARSLFNQYLLFDNSMSVSIEELNSSAVIAERYQVVRGARATTVEKTDEIRRMIAVEPTANMFLQQGLMAMFYRRMSAFGLDVAKLPEHHKKLARLSSITRKFSTIDFSSASDCVSVELARWLLPPRWFMALDMVRCKEMSILDKTIQLNMISTMGNATTFPLETLVFWTLGHAVISTHKQNNNSTLMPSVLKGFEEQFALCSVFGDDCILPTEYTADFISVTRSVGFIVNESKTHCGNDPFRESCGGDYLTGYSVRPYRVTWPTALSVNSSLEPWLYTIWNGLLEKYILYFGPHRYIYTRLFEVFTNLFRHYSLDIKVVPDFYPDDSGLKISEDIERFVANYKPPLSGVYKSKHGTYSFRYLRFQYRKNRRTDDGIRYNIALKQGYSSLDHPRFTPIRRIGGYCVARGITAHWTVANVIIR